VGRDRMECSVRWSQLILHPLSLPSVCFSSLLRSGLQVSLRTVLGRGVEGATVTLASAKLMAKGSSSAKTVAQDKV